MHPRCLPLLAWSLCLVAALLLSAGRTTAQDGDPNPTPLVITLTPAASATPPSPPVTETAVPTETPENTFPPDRFEPNDDPAAAPAVGLVTEPGLTLVHGDVDYFTLYLKAGQWVAVSTTVYEGLDTQLELFWQGELLAANDDRAADDVGSAVMVRAPAAGWYLLRVAPATVYSGRYDLEIAPAAPTATVTASATATGTATAAPSPTASPTTTPTLTPLPPVAGPPPWTGNPVRPASPTPFVLTPPLTVTASISTTGRLSLTVRHLGPAVIAATAPATHVRLLVYYDANNDRQPGPGEGVAHVSVLAVDAQGQRLARVFTNLQGEAVFNLSNPALARVMVPFVPGWSAQVRAGQVNDIVLGLPAVRLPVFLPVQSRPAGEE